MEMLRYVPRHPERLRALSVSRHLCLARARHKLLDLIDAIEAFLAAHNDDPKPFVWTASADAILAKVGRCKAVLETLH